MKLSKWGAVALHFTTSCLLAAALYIYLSADERYWALILALSAALIKELKELARAIRDLIE